MAYSLSPWLKPRFFITGTNRPLAGGLMYTYKAGTTDNATTYSDDTGTPNTNPIVLDSDGQCDLYLDDSISYRIILKNSAGVTQFDKDRVASLGSTQVQSFDNIAALRLRSGTTTANAAKTLGYYSAGDGGANSFYWDGTSTATDNSGTVIKPTSVSGAGRWLATNPELTTLLQWGAFADGTITDDSAKINAYLTYMALNGWKATGVGDYRIDSKITIKGNADFSEMNLNVYGSPAVAVEVSTGSSANPTDHIIGLNVLLPKTVINKDKVGLGWGTSIGVRAVNLYSSNVTTGIIQGFGVGFQPTAYGSVGNVYNTYTIGFLENNKINLDITPQTSTSWVNENLFIGGRLSHNSGEGVAVTGVRQIRLSKSTLVVNNNVFIKPSIEGNVPEYHVECGGSYNSFNQCRWEATTPKMLYTGDNTNQGALNVIFGGYGVQNIAYTYTGTTGTKNKTIMASGGYETVNIPIGISNLASSNNDIYRFYESGTLPETAGSNDWSMGIGSSAVLGKRKADTYARMKLEFQNGRIYFDNGTTAAPTKYIGAFGNDDFAFTNHVSASVDNTYTCGRASQRWSVVYAASATILTSDERSKQQITSDLSPELTAWSKVEFCKYKLNDAVEKKGKDGARWHFGVIAQQVKKAFEDEGLDPFEYGILCYDEWEAIEETVDSDGVMITQKVEAGNRYGIRYEEALILECAYLRSKIE